MATIKLSELGEIYSLNSSGLFYVVSGSTSYKITKGNALSDVYGITNTVGDVTTLTTTNKATLVSAVNELDSDIGDLTTLLNELVYTENVKLIENLTINANTNTPVNYKDLSPKSGYVPIIATWQNTWGGQVTLWYVNVGEENGTWKIAWRARNVSSSQITGITIYAKVIYIKTSCFGGELNPYW